MKSVKREMKRKGFTLVELLIVIVVIGVLSAMMMLSSTEAVSSAKASNIVSNLRNMKTAALAWFADHLDTAEAFSSTGDSADDLSKHKGDILGYLSNVEASQIDSGEYAKYEFSGTSATTWFVYYETPDKTVAEKLAGRAPSVGLYNTNAAASANYYTKTDATNQVNVYMNIR